MLFSITPKPSREARPVLNRAQVLRRRRPRPVRSVIAEWLLKEEPAAARWPLSVVPAGSVATAVPAEPAMPARAAVPVAPRIILAGADAAQGLLLRRALEIDGCSVLACVSGVDAAHALIATPPEVMLINAPLPDGSAAALLRWARAREATADVTCVVILPAGEAHLVASLYDAGADLVITRPTELGLLSRKVSAALARRPLAVAA